MEELAGYLRTLCCGAILCAVVLQLMGSSAAGKLLCGLFLAVLAISPLRHLDFGAMEREFSDFSLDAEAVSLEGHRQAESAIREGISQRCEAYILDEAGKLGIEPQAEVDVDRETHLPVAVTLQGTASARQKTRLEEQICRALGVERSRVTWKH